MAGRNVGSIEITVDADTGKMTAKLVGASRKTGEAMADEIDKGLGEVDGRTLLLKLRKIRQQAEEAMRGIDVDIELDEAALKADIRKLQAQLRATQLTLKANPEFDDEELQRELAAARAMLGEIDVTVNTEANRADIKALKEEIQLLLAGISVKVRVDVDEDELVSTRARIESKFREMGDSAGTSFGDGLSGRMKLILGAVAELAQPAAVLLQGALSGAVQVLSSAFSGLAGTAGAVVPIFLTMGGLVAGGVVGFQGFGDAIKAMNKEFSASVEEGREFNIEAEDVQKTLAQLSPEARKVAGAFADIVPELRDIRLATQDELFEGLDVKLKLLADTLLPQVGLALDLAADSLNTFFKDLADVGTDLELGDLFRSMQPAIDDLLHAVVLIIDAIEPFFRAATPAAGALAKSIEAAAESLGKMIDEGVKSGALMEFLVEGVESLKDWFRLIGEVGKALFTLFDAGKDGGDGLVQSLTDIVGKFNDWMKSVAGQKALDNFFKSGTTIIESLAPLLEGVSEAFDNLITPAAIGAFADLAADIGELLPVFAEFLALMAQASITDVLVQGFTSLFTALTNLEPIITIIAEIIANIPGPVVAAGLAFLAMVKAIQAVSAAMTAMKTVNSELLILSAAAALAVGAMSLFNDEESETSKRASEAAQSLVGQVNELVNIVTAADVATVSTRALSRALADTTGATDKLNIALGVIGKTTDDTADIFIKIGKNPVKALSDLAEQAGLTAEQAEALGLAVELTDEDFSTFAKSVKRALEGNAAETDLIELAKQFEALGIGVEDLTPEFIAIGSALEEIQDQADGVDIDKTVKEFLNARAASDKTTQSLLAQAEEMTGLKRTGEDLLPLYDQFTALLASNKLETDAASAAAATLQQNIEDQRAAMEGALDPLRETKEEMSEVAKQATAAADAASAMTEAFDLLINPMLDQQATWDELQQAISDTNTQIFNAVAGNDEFTKSLTDNSEGALKNREVIRDQISAILDFAAAQVTAGEDTGFVATQVSMLRQQLIDQLTQFGLTTAEAEAYVNALGLTPESIETTIATPGMEEGLTDTDAFIENVDKMKGVVQTEFEHKGLEDSNTKAADYKKTTDDTKAKVSTDFEHTGLEDASTKADTYKETLDDTPDQVATGFIQTGLTNAQTKASEYSETLDGIDSIVNTTFTLLSGSAQVELDNIKRKIDALDGRVITVTTKVTGVPGFAMGGVVGAMGGIGGEAGPEFISRGGRSAVIDSPTFLAPGTVVTPLNSNPTGPAVGKQINLYQTILPQSADPVAVATQIVNRAVAMAQQV